MRSAAVLRAFYGQDMTVDIEVRYKKFSDGSSKFHCDTDAVFINTKTGDPVQIQSLTTHESSHIALCRMTHKFNIQTESRFWDEGLATIFQYRMIGEEQAYRIRSLHLALEQWKRGRLKFDHLKGWPAYSRDVIGKINSYAYAEGSSFLYDLIATYGENRLKVFLVNLGQTNDLAPSLRNVYQITEHELEMAWGSYLSKTYERRRQ